MSRDLAAALTAMTDPGQSCLILPQPFHIEFDDRTIHAIDQWVGRGGGLFFLGYYLAAIHHEANPNALARVLGFEFAPDLLMPAGRQFSRNDYMDQAFYDKPDYVASTGPPPDFHALVDGVSRLSLVSACSLEIDTPQAELVISSGPVSVIEAKGPKTQQGYILQIRDYVETGIDDRPVVAAWRHGAGKVVACGTWKLFSFAEGDNARLIANALDWLSSQRGASVAGAEHCFVRAAPSSLAVARFGPVGRLLNRTLRVR